MTLIVNAFKSLSVKTQLLVIRSEKHNKISGFPLARWTSFRMSSNWCVPKMKKSREDFWRLKAPPRRPDRKVITKFRFWLNNVKDSMPWWRREMLRSELWVAKSMRLKKQWDCLLNKLQSFHSSWMTSDKNTICQASSQKHTNKESKNYWARTLIWMRKLEVLKKTLDFLLDKWASFRTNSRLLVTKLRSSREESMIYLTPTRKLENMKEKLLFFPRKLKD